MRPSAHTLILLFLLSLPLPSHANQVDPGNWASDCDGDYCVFRKSLIPVGEKTAFALLEILVHVTDGNATLVLTAPLGVALQPGVQITVDQQTWNAPLKVCYPDGCRATIEISNDDFALLLQRRQMELRYVPFSGDAPVAANLPLSGLVAAISRTR